MFSLLEPSVVESLHFFCCECPIESGLRFDDDKFGLSGVGTIDHILMGEGHIDHAHSFDFFRLNDPSEPPLVGHTAAGRDDLSGVFVHAGWGDQAAVFDEKLLEIAQPFLISHKWRIRGQANEPVNIVGGEVADWLDELVVHTQANHEQINGFAGDVADPDDRDSEQQQLGRVRVERL